MLLPFYLYEKSLLFGCVICEQLVRSFTWTITDSSTSSQLDAHVTQAQTLLSLVLHHPELCTELYCQLIKQTSKHPPQQKSAGMQVCVSHCVVVCLWKIIKRGFVCQYSVNKDFHCHLLCRDTAVHHKRCLAGEIKICLKTLLVKPLT